MPTISFQEICFKISISVVNQWISRGSFLIMIQPKIYSETLRQFEFLIMPIYINKYGCPQKVNKLIQLLYNFSPFNHIHPSSLFKRNSQWKFHQNRCFTREENRMKTRNSLRMKQQIPAYSQNQIFIGFVITTKMSKRKEKFFNSFPTQFHLPY